MSVPGGPAAFMSYVRFNDQHDDGQLSQFRERLEAEVRAQTGEEFAIFQDRNDIAWGQNWQLRIDEALDAVTLLLVIITPSLFRSPACRAEFQKFRERERGLGRSDLILPVYYIGARELEDPALPEADDMARVLASRQFADWRELRFKPFTSPPVRKAVAQLASRMRDTFWQPPPPAPPQPTPEPKTPVLIELNDPETKFGSTEVESNVVINAPGTAPLHFTLTREGTDRLRLREFGHGHGPYRYGQPVRRSELLKPGDYFDFNDHRYCVRDGCTELEVTPLDPVRLIVYGLWVGRPADPQVDSGARPTLSRC